MIVEHIGPVPASESCAQVGHTPDYETLATLESRLYIAALTAKYGRPPEGCRLRLKRCAHDFGSYVDVVAEAPETDEGEDWIARIESGLDRWSDAAIAVPAVTYYHGADKPSVHYRSVAACLHANLELNCFSSDEGRQLRAALADLLTELEPARIAA